MLKPSWSNEETVFDFMKLLDVRNSSFRHVVSFGLILRGNGLPPGAETYRSLAAKAFAEAVRWLGQFYKEGDRTVYFVITDVASDGRRHHYYDPVAQGFVTTGHLPPFLVDAANVP